MDEFDIIDRFFRRGGDQQGVAVGIGDDGAVLEPTAGKHLVSVVDTLVDGVHFPPGLEPADVGYRSVAVNISDIAAMGARPRWMTLALTLAEADADWLEQFARGLFEAADACGVALVGGDTTRGAGTVVSIQVLGEVDEGRAVTRAGACPGDRIFVTGTLGDAAAGLRVIQSGAPVHDAAACLARRFARPPLRPGLGAAVAAVASAAIDISDGLCADLSRLLAASDVSGRIAVEALPLSDEIITQAGQEAATAHALGGGDDYELCFTAPRDAGVAERMAASGLVVTKIGEIAGGAGLTATRDGLDHPLDASGYRHFA